MPEEYDVIIIGAGVSGLSAAMYAGRLKLKTLVIGEVKGGTIITTNEIRNWPGIKLTDGMALAKDIEEHAREYDDVEIKQDIVESIEKKAKGYVVSTSAKKYTCRSIILSTGTSVRKLGVPGEEQLKNKGVHYCALCDGFFYKDKTVAVIGGSDSAAKEALLLTQWAKKVFIIYRKEIIRAEPYNMDRIKENKKIEIINNTNVVKINGEKKLENLELDREYKGKKVLAMDAVFVEIGHLPVSGLVNSIGVELNEKGEIKINRRCETNVPGVFAAGDVVDDRFKQAIIGSAEGVMAAYGAYEYLRNGIR